MNKHILTDDKRELEMQRAHALKAIDALLAELLFLRMRIEERPTLASSMKRPPSSMR